MQNMAKVITLKESELKKIIKEAIDEVTAYHYSNADFNDFDLGFVNTGNKMQAWGYGIYVSLSDEGAKSYGKNQYVVEIPSDNKLYLNNWKYLSPSYINKVKTALFNYMIKNGEDESWVGVEKELMDDLNMAFQDMTGSELYGTISSYLGGDKHASDFCYNILKKIGLKFKVKDITNAVMFNPKDIKIVNKSIYKQEDETEQ